MAPRWLRNEEAEAQQAAEAEARRQAEIKGVEIKPEMLTEAMKPHLESFRTEVSTQMDEKLRAVNEYFAEQNRLKTIAAQKKQQEDENPEEVDFFTDPSGAMDKKLAPLLRSQQAANAMIMIQETIGEMDYYKSDPNFKAKVIAKINSQPLSVRSNPDIILNCYKLVRYDEEEAIKEGKYKSVLGASSTGGTGGHTGTTRTEDEVTISDEEKVYAKKMGISEADWVKSKKTLEYV